MAGLEDATLQDSLRVSPDVQLQRDKVRLNILQQERVDNPDDPFLQKEITTTTLRQESGNPWGGRGSRIAAELKGQKFVDTPLDVSATQAVAPAAVAPAAQSTKFVDTPLYPDETPVAPEEKPKSPTLKDVGLALGAGGVNVATTIAQGAKFFADKAGLTDMAESAKDWRDTFQGYEKFYTDKLSKGGKEALEGDLSNHLFGTFFMNAVQSAPGMVAMAGPAGLIAKGLEGAAVATRATTALMKAGVAPEVAKAAGLAHSANVGGVTGELVADALSKLGVGAARAGRIGAAAPGAIGAGLSEGIFSALQNGAQTAEEVRGKTDAEILQHPVAKAAMDAMDPSIPYADRVRQVRNAMANAAESQVILRTTPWTAIVGMVSGGGLLGQITRPSKGILKGAGKAALSEGVYQEAPQSYGEQVIQNLAAQNFYEQNRDPLQDALKQAVIGAGSGAMSGALGGAAHGAMAHEAPQAAPAPGGPAIPPAGGAPAGGAIPPAATQPAAVPAGTPPAAGAPPAGMVPVTLSPIDQARADAKTLTDGGTLPDADPVRLKNATLVKTYGENAAVRHVIDFPEKFSAIGDAMLAVAPTVERVRGTIQNNAGSRDISADILDAVDEVRKIKDSGKSLAEVMAEGATHDISYEGQQLLQFLDENHNNPKALASFMESYLHEVEQAGGAPSEVRGRAFDIIKERNDARKEKEAALQEERKQKAFAKAEATAKREKAVTTEKAIEQAGSDRVEQAIAVAKAAGSGVNPEAKTAMQIALENAKPLKGKQNAKQGAGTTGNVQAAAASGVAAGSGQNETGGRTGAIPESAKVGEQGNARSNGSSGNQQGAQAANEGSLNRGAQIANERAKAGTRENPVIASRPKHIAEAAAVAQESPSAAQKEANNYQKGHFRFADDHPLASIGTVSIETAKGKERTAADGSWTVKNMPYHYGHLQNAMGKDGDKADIAIGPDLDSPNVYVIDQINPDTGKYDETKSFVGFKSERAARNAYVRGFSDGRGNERIGAINEMTTGQFVARVQSNNLVDAVSYKNQPRGKRMELSDIPRHLEIRFPAGTTEKGETVYTVKNARQAYKETSQKVDRLESLRDCLRG